MFLNAYYQNNQDAVVISAEQGSCFAKEIACDFNPIHNPDHKRFCVPGDLLFAVSLDKYGLSQQMTFTFEGMVGKEVNLQFPATIDQTFQLTDDKDKQYLSLQRSGENSQDPTKIEAFIRCYVAFSGLNFMEVLVPLMTKHQMMINPARPLVIYESMSFNLESFDFDVPELKLQHSELSISGKRGDVKLTFDILSAGKKVGTGYKTLILSGLRPFEQEKIDGLIAEYARIKDAA